MSATLKILKARHGDAFIFECIKDEGAFYMVVDSGPRLSSKDIVPLIKTLPQIDLLVLTHYDEDHIMGFIDYFKQYPEDALKIKEYWLLRKMAKMLKTIMHICLIIIKNMTESLLLSCLQKKTNYLLAMQKYM